MRLIYLSPVPWASFAQRPHAFVGWFHARSGAEVLWIDPYPTRLPALADLARLRARAAPSPPPTAVPPWLRVLRPRALPIEPLAGSGCVNRVLWGSLLAQAEAFARDEQTLLVFGKPALLALQLRHRLGHCAALYDAMDDFPAFYRGLSCRAMRRREQLLAQRVDAVWASSSALARRWSGVRSDVQLVPNGLDAALVPPPRPRPGRGARIFGYVGTMASWFDWSVVGALARARPLDRVRLVGPLYTPPPAGLPHNVELRPACGHAQALQAMNAFDVGLIPFKRNALTAGVDPIKFYEYRALGLPVVSTVFGEMALRGDADAVFLFDGAAGIVQAAAQAVACAEPPDPGFARRHAWSARFDAAHLPGARQAAR